MKHTKKFVGAGVGLVAFAAGAHFLYGKKGAQNREKVKGWALKARGEMLEKLEKLREVNKGVYEKVVDEVARRYRRLKQVDRAELKKLVQDAKKYWPSIVRSLPEKLRKANGKPKKIVKKKAKKA